ncbi:MAG: FAD:protein FMN transferase [Treponema sp.]|nr:FAD:protein FMN transferase [Treponema sp.]
MTGKSPAQLLRQPGMVFAALALSIFLNSGCKKIAGPGAQAEYVLGTYCRIDLFENGNGELYNRLFSRLAELDRLLSANRDDSELAQVNRNAGLEPASVSPELLAVLERSLYFAEISGGAFDPTVGPLVKLWGIGTETPRIPPEEEIRVALDLVNWRDLEITRQNGGTAFLKRRGMALDLGAIAKGYAADELAEILRKAGIPRAIIDLGGNAYVWGTKNGGDPWSIGVQDPMQERGNYAGILKLGNSASIVSSGIYERYFTENGRRWHHIMDLTEAGGRRGYPAENGLFSTTVILTSSMDADALSTACFVLGYEKGLALARANGAEILFIFEDKTIRGSPGALEAFSLTGDYRIP